MTILHLFIVLGLGAGVSLLALKRLRALRRRRHAEDEHRARRQRLERLAELVDEGERDAHFNAETAGRLRRFVDDLRTEAR